MCIWCELQGNQPRWDASLFWAEIVEGCRAILQLFVLHNMKISAHHLQVGSVRFPRYPMHDLMCTYIYIYTITHIYHIYHIYIYMYYYVICVLVVRCQNGCQLGRWGALGGRLCGRGLWLSQQRQRIRHLEPLWKPAPWRQGHVPILMLWMILNVYRPIYYLGETWWHHDIQFYHKKKYIVYMYIYIYTYIIYCIYIYIYIYSQSYPISYPI